MAPGARLAAGTARHGSVQRLPLGEAVCRRVPTHGSVVPVAHGDDPAGPADTTHLDERTDRVGEMLEDLVGVDDVEGPVAEAERVDVTDLEAQVPPLGGFGKRPGLFEHLGRGVEADDMAVWDASGEADGDGPRAAADIEHPRVGGEARKEVGGGVLDATPAVRAEHAVVVAVQVGGLGCSRFGGEVFPSSGAQGGEQCPGPPPVLDAGAKRSQRQAGHSVGGVSVLNCHMSSLDVVRAASGIGTHQDSRIPEKCSRQCAHLTVGKVLRIEPLHSRGLITIGFGRPAHHLCVKDRDHVGRLVPVGIRHAVLETTEDAQYRAESKRYRGFLFSLPDGSAFWRLVGFYRTSNGRPQTRIQLLNQQQPTAVIPGKHSHRWQYEEFISHEPAELLDEGGDHHRIKLQAAMTGFCVVHPAPHRATRQNDARRYRYRNAEPHVWRACECTHPRRHQALATPGLEIGTPWLILKAGCGG